VLVKGRASEVVDEAERAALQRLAVRPWAPQARERWIRIVAHSVTGRAISRRPSKPPREALPPLPD
jgi:hypothetical protein